MKTIYLLRHAHAEAPAGPAMDDHDRPLSARGIAEAENCGAFMHEQNLKPDLMLCSTSVRTRETARLVLDIVFEGDADIESRFERSLYLADPDNIIDEIHNADDRFERLLLVGHNPGFEDMAEKMARATAQEIGRFPPCTLAVFNIEIDKWQQFAPKKARLKTVFMP